MEEEKQNEQVEKVPICKLQEQLHVARNELKNIRTACESLKRQQHKFVSEIGETLQRGASGSSSCLQLMRTNDDMSSSPADLTKSVNWSFVPIGTIHSTFKNKNGTPRQSTVCQQSTATLQLNKSILSNPDHALHGLEQFSHFWILFAFHKNDKTQYNKGKVAPPRLDGQRVGVFATRSPHRPNPIGLSLTKLIKIDGDSIHLSGVDVIDGTPVLDIKPYIPDYDMPAATNRIWEDCGRQPSVKTDSEPMDSESRPTEMTTVNVKTFHSKNIIPETDIQTIVQSANDEPDMRVLVADWLLNPPVEQLTVHFTNRCLKQLEQLFSGPSVVRNELQFTCSLDVTKMIGDILREDPRSVYRRHHCQDQLYYFSLNNLHVTCWFDTKDRSVEVLKITYIEKNAQQNAN